MQFQKFLSLLLLITMLAPSLTIYAAPGDGNGGGRGGGGRGGGGHGGGPGNPGGPGDPTPPNPPTPLPPTPLPPIPPTGPSPAEIEAARNAGYQDGIQEGRNDGSRRGAEDGRNQGTNAGERDGFSRCEREEQERARNSGYQDGYRRGQDEGAREGYSRGLTDGESRGRSEGYSDGQDRANRDAYDRSTPPGRARGEEQASASDAAVKGNADGITVGDRDAQADADRVEYPRGRKDYSDAMWASPVESQDAFNQKAPFNEFKFKKIRKEEISNLKKSNSDIAKEISRGIIHVRSYGTPEEQQAYNEGFSRGKSDGYNQTYQTAYNEMYRRSFEQGTRIGCENARRQNYRNYYDAGLGDGQRRGYDDAYQPAFRRGYDETYGNNFRNSSQRAYDENYQRFYDQHFEEARSAAYQRRYQEIYDAAFKPAHDAKYAQMYPGYAKVAFERGRIDEKADFESRPVRMLGVESTETIVNGLVEPGEAIRFRVKLRNFDEAALNANDIKVAVQELDSGSAVVSEPNSLLAQNLNRKSITTVSELLELRMNESSVNQNKRFKVQITFRGKDVGSQLITVTPKFMVDTKYAEPPKVLEGMETKLKIKIKNQSNKALDANATLKIKADPETLDFATDTVAIGSMAAGEERVILFPVISRKRGWEVKLPITVEASTGSGRRVGLMINADSIEQVNEYRVEAEAPALAGLRKAGVTRVPYLIRNIGSDLGNRNMQMTIRFLGAGADNFKVIGPNPQYIAAIPQKDTLSFMIPVLSKANNSGGVMELELKEDGKIVVINRNKF